MKTAMILAAGRGERLRPLSDVTPKGLCLVKGYPLIAYHLQKLKAANFERIIINHAHLGGQIRRYVGDGAVWGLDIHYSAEFPGGLETGGGIFQALELLGTGPFVTVNADIYTDYPFAQLRLPKNSLAHLVLAPNPKHHPRGDFSLDEQSQLHLGNPSFTFLGVAAYDPTAFLQAKPGRYPLRPILHELIRKQRISGELYTGLWMDIGTAARLAEAEQS